MKIRILAGPNTPTTLWEGALEAFETANEDDPIPPDILTQIRNLEVDETRHFSVGAGGSFTVMRVE